MGVARGRSRWSCGGELGYNGRMRESPIVAKAREIVGRHKLPDFIVGFDVRLGDFDGDPAMWIVLKTAPGPTSWGPELDRQVKAIQTLKEAIRPDLLAAFDDRYPYFRVEDERNLQPATG